MPLKKIMQSLLMLSLSCVAGENDVSAMAKTEDVLKMHKKAITKLIEENDELKSRVFVLEERVAKMEDFIYSKNSKPESRIKDKNVKKLPVYFAPALLSTVRKMPTSSSEYIITLKSTSRVEITEIECKGEAIGFWGKTKEGWVYISSSTYGKIYDLQGAEVTQEYKYWCN